MVPGILKSSGFVKRSEGMALSRKITGVVISYLLVPIWASESLLLAAWLGQRDSSPSGKSHRDRNRILEAFYLDSRDF